MKILKVKVKTSAHDNLLIKKVSENCRRKMQWMSATLKIMMNNHILFDVSYE